jgi:hypothetical protein
VHFLAGLIVVVFVAVIVGQAIDDATDQARRFQELDRQVRADDPRWTAEQAASMASRKATLRRVQRLNRWVRLNHWLRG